VIGGNQLGLMGGDDSTARSVGTHASPARLLVRCPLRASLALLAVLAGMLALSAPALADGEVSYMPGSSFKAEGECVMTEPGEAAVNESTGDIYVLDRATDFVARFGPSGECLGLLANGKAAKVGSLLGGLAVDNTSGPSAGDVYVEGQGGHAVYKFSAEGTFLSAITNEFEQVHGVAVDSKGTLWVYQGKGEETSLESFSDEIANVFVAALELQLECAPRRGLAVGPNAQSFYVGRARENRKEKCEPVPVAVKLNGAGETATESTGNGTPGGPAFFAQLDNESTTGFGVDEVSGEVFIDNGSSLTAFSPLGQFVQRFGNEGTNALQAGTGVTVDAASEKVYAVDAREGGIVDAFVPKAFEEVPLQQGLTPLPDGRAWEQVSPPNKLGSSIFAITQELGTVEASANGNAITYTSNAPIVADPPTNRANEPTQNISRRGATAWSTEDIVPPSELPVGYPGSTGTAYEAFSDDLSLGFVNPAQHQVTGPNEPRLSPEATETSPFRRDLTVPTSSCEPLPSSCYQALISPLDDFTEIPFGAAGNLLKTKFASATPDGQHAILFSQVPLTPEGAAQGAEEGLYEWAAGGSGSLKLVSVLPAGDSGITEAGEPLDLRLGGEGKNAGAIMRNAISTDGSRVVWSTKEGTGRLYLRDTVKSETIRLDLKQGVAKQPKGAHAVYQAASADGKRIFFTDVVPLTEDATTENGENAEEAAEAAGSGDLYVCEVTEEPETGKLGCTLKDLTASVAAANEEAAVQGVIGASENGTYVYFVADGVLSPTAGVGSCQPRSNAEIKEERAGILPTTRCNLYVEHFNGEAWETPGFIASLSSLDRKDWFADVQRGALVNLTARVSPNGSYIAFMSKQSLTGYNNVDVNPAAKGARDSEVFLYHAQGNSVLCVSCKPGGAPPQGIFDTKVAGEGLGLIVDRPELWAETWVAGNIPGWTGRSLEVAIHQSRYLSDSGRLFFNSADALVPAAEGDLRKETVNGEEVSVGVENVYEFEPGGVGNCASETGCISLISSGNSKQESAFLDASADGSDVFFLTSQQLVPAVDQDNAFDIYDARVCTGGAPCLNPQPEVKKVCLEEACKSGVTSVAAPPAVPPSTQPGAGNGPPKIEVRPESTTPKPELTRAQKLKKALKACKKLKRKKKRVACEHKAKRKYGPVKKGKK
jgi:hypothetical protein